MRRITLIPNTSKIVQVNNYLFKKAKCPKQKTEIQIVDALIGNGNK